MIWHYIKNIIKRYFGKPDDKEWFNKLVENLENKKAENANLPFKILEARNEGFLVKIAGLYAFISFYHMPWKYYNTDSWVAVSSKLIDKIFYCKIHSIKKEPLSVLLDGEIPQFKKTELIVGQKYRGIIIGRFRKALQVDIGYHFDWKYGSFVGFLKKAQYNNSKQLFSRHFLGEEIEVFYHGLNEKGRFVFSQFESNNEVMQALAGQTVLVHVVRQDKKEAQFLVNGKYEGRIYYSYNNDFWRSNECLSRAKNDLKDGDIIHCEVIAFIEDERILELKWIVEPDIEIAKIEHNSSVNEKEQPVCSQLEFEEDHEIMQELIDQEVLVQVVRKQGEKKVEFWVNGKYKGEINSSDSSYLGRIKSGLKKAKKNLRNGDVIHCKVIDFNEKKRILELNWNADSDIEIIGKEGNSKVLDNLDNNVIQKLITLRNTIK